MIGRTYVGVIIAYAAMCIIWGTTWLGVKVSVHYVPPLVGLGLRLVLAGLTMYILARVVGTPRGTTLPWKVITVLAICLFGLNYVLIYVCETRVDSGLAAVMFATFPFFVFAFGHMVLGEKTSPRIWLGATIALAAVGMILLNGNAHGSLLFAIAPVGAAAIASFGTVYARRHAHHSPLTILPAAMLTSGIVIVCVGLVTEPISWQRVLAFPSLSALFYLSIIGSCVAFYLHMWLLQRIPASIIGLAQLIIPVIAVTVGALLGGDQFKWSQLVGSAMVMAGMWIALKPTVRGRHNGFGLY